jgi:hypothetical protein
LIPVFCTKDLSLLLKSFFMHYFKEILSKY